VIQREHANCHYCILLNAGDPVQGTPVSTNFHGLPVYEVANLLGFDAATLGNHEFELRMAAVVGRNRRFARHPCTLEVARDFDVPALDFVLRRLAEHPPSELAEMARSFAYASCEIHQDQLGILTPFLAH
jgi:hypothetical protein